MTETPSYSIRKNPYASERPWLIIEKWGRFNERGTFSAFTRCKSWNEAMEVVDEYHKRDREHERSQHELNMFCKHIEEGDKNK